MACEIPETVYAAQVVANANDTYIVRRWVAEGVFGNVVVKQRGPFLNEALAAKTARALVDCSMTGQGEPIPFNTIFVNRDVFTGVYFGAGHTIGCVALLFAEKKRGYTAAADVPQPLDAKQSSIEAVVHLRVGVDFSAEVQHLKPLALYRVEVSADELTTIVEGFVPCSSDSMETMAISNAVYEALVTKEAAPL